MGRNKFFTKNRDLPTLYEVMILAEAVYPFLFVCEDEQGTLYICSCYCANAEKRAWIIGRTEPAAIVELLTDQCTIREIFDRCGCLCMVTKYTCRQDMETKWLSIEEIKKLETPYEGILPTEGYFMDAEEDEFREEHVLSSQIYRQK